MSKASEYAKAIKAFEQIERPILRVNSNGDIVARVLNSGILDIEYAAPLTADLALKLAHWIIDMFGETE